MDKETALYWQEIIKRVDKGDREAMKIFMEEFDRRWQSGLPTISEDIMDVLNPRRTAPQKDWDGMPPIICEWP